MLAFKKTLRTDSSLANARTSRLPLHSLLRPSIELHLFPSFLTFDLGSLLSSDVHTLLTNGQADGSGSKRLGLDLCVGVKRGKCAQAVSVITTIHVQIQNTHATHMPSTPSTCT
jgi:hypothetical protein